MNELVLDPFCGCGTTIDAAEKNGRDWIGIDVTQLAITLIKKRLFDTYGYKPAVRQRQHTGAGSGRRGGGQQQARSASRTQDVASESQSDQIRLNPTESNLMIRL